MSLFRLRASFGSIMKLLLLLSLLGATVFCHDDSCETSDNSDSFSDSSEGGGGSGARCPSGWMTFDRPRGRWCVKVYTGNIDWYAARERCESRGARLTGVQNKRERMAIANEGRRLARANSVDLASIWLGATRKPECALAGFCNPKETFEWTDGFTTGKSGFHWGYLEPDGYFIGHIAQDTIQLLVFTNGDTHPAWPYCNHGDLDDQWKTEINGPSTRFYACGKTP